MCVRVCACVCVCVCVCVFELRASACVKRVDVRVMVNEWCGLPRVFCDVSGAVVVAPRLSLLFASVLLRYARAESLRVGCRSGMRLNASVLPV